MDVDSHIATEIPMFVQRQVIISLSDVDFDLIIVIIKVNNLTRLS